jgi:cytochrome c oxidase subunit 3
MSERVTSEPATSESVHDTVPEPERVRDHAQAPDSTRDLGDAGEGLAAPPTHGGAAHVAHHFDDAVHQFEAGKLGIWLFLAQEVLFFAGLFCVYTVFRANHPEIFVYAHRFLDVRLGALNTGVLITSSLSAAWAVRAAQLNQRRVLIFCLSATIVLAFVFFVVKGIEYEHKWKQGLLWGHRYHPVATATTEARPETGVASSSAAVAPPMPTPASAPTPVAKSASSPTAMSVPGSASAPVLSSASASRSAPTSSSVSAPALVSAPDGVPAAGSPAAAGHQGEDPGEVEPRNVHIFFGIYFIMTGLHGVHVLAGIIVFLWLLRRALRGDFGSRNVAAVDGGALYWHLVDLVWIYLFPLLYLVH